MSYLSNKAMNQGQRPHIGLLPSVNITFEKYVIKFNLCGTEWKMIRFTFVKIKKKENKNGRHYNSLFLFK